MGIELDHLSPRRPAYQARCDNCDTYLEIDASTPNVARLMLRDMGWVRKDYIETAHHYVWYCPKCFYKD